MKIWALSGFLGLPRDWDFLQCPHLVGVDYQNFCLNSLSAWGQDFNCWINQQHSQANIIMGYSLGGRMALHALIEQPQLWHAAIIISTHTGLKKQRERQKRLNQDQMWAERFEKEPWNSLIRDWNAQKFLLMTTFALIEKKLITNVSRFQRFLLAALLGVNKTFANRLVFCQYLFCG